VFPRWTESSSQSTPIRGRTKPVAGIPQGVLAFNEREYETYRGHILAIGAPPGFQTSDVGELRERVLDAGGLLILAHPFRFYPSSLSLLFPRAWHEPGEWPPERLAEHPLFEMVDAVEAWNGRVMPAQNRLAEACARIHGLPVVGGSDSHSAANLGRYATEFADEIETRDGLLAAIRAGRCRPVELTATGRYRRLDADA